ncbi:MAG: hypothetical protein MUF00_11035 [Gemmatimonadaceae bacterium]|nr:hypothetical protein [Gemmatimonadaceae bacterium]
MAVVRAIARDAWWCACVSSMVDAVRGVRAWRIVRCDDVVLLRASFAIPILAALVKGCAVKYRWCRYRWCGVNAPQLSLSGIVSSSLLRLA